MYIKRKFKRGEKELTRYWKGNKLVSITNVPQYVVDSPLFGEPITEGTESVPKTEKTCVFCGKPAKYSRFVHLQTVYLCDEDIQTKSLGAVGAKVKELQINH